MLWEVEQKFRLTDATDVAAKLGGLGVELADAIEQTDHYFNHPARDFSHTDEALRLRQVGEQNFTTYKGRRVDSTTKTRRELELPLPPSRETKDQFAALLTVLGFRPAGTVHKHRRKGELAWEGRSIEVALDEVDQLGSFLELEIASNDADLEPAKKSLQSLASCLGVTNSERKSYLELLLEKQS